MLNRDELRDTLNHRVLIVEFTKKSTGNTRVMKCTTSPVLIPKEHHPKSNTEQHAHSIDLFKVYDLEAQGWRSFDYTTLTKVDLGTVNG